MTKPQSVRDIAANMKARYKKNGSPEIYKNEQDELCPNCDMCKGSGYLSYNAPVGHPDFGKLRVCPNRKIDYSKTSRLKDDDLALTWDDYETYENANTVKVKTTIQTMINPEAKATPGMIYIHGEVGRGKSHLLKIAVAEAIRSNLNAVYIHHLEEIIANLRESFDQKRSQTTLGKRKDYWSDIPILAIDEFDKYKDTEFLRKELSHLIDMRYNSAISGKTITIIASNSAPEDIGDPHVISRIRDVRNRVIELTGADMRKIKRSE